MAKSKHSGAWRGEAVSCLTGSLLCLGSTMDADQRRKVAVLLQESPWFKGLPSDIQSLILDRAIVRSHPKGAFITHEGDPPLGLSAVLEGRLWIVQHVGTDTEHLVHVAEPGFWTGEFAVLTGRPAAVTVISRTPSRTLLLPYDDFEEIAARHPVFYRATAQLALGRFGLMLRHISEAHRLTAEGRLRAVLADRAVMRSWDRPNEDPICLTLSQEELARLVGLSRQTLNGLLQKLQDEGLIETSFRAIYVLDPAGLRQAP